VDDVVFAKGEVEIGVLPIFAEFERAMVRERVMAGLKRAKANGTTLGRPRIDEAAKTAAQKALRSGKGIIKVAKELGLGVGTVHRIKLEMNETA
jgi:DNA invertase Pin-like site-specific DNA recombinase